MKYKIGQSVLVERQDPITEQEFTATISDIVNGQYIVEDQAGDFFTVEESEISLLTE
jgi:hypothetical protein